MLTHKKTGLRVFDVLRALFVLALSALSVAWAGDQTPPADSSAAEPLAAWEFILDAPISQEGDSPWIDFVLTPDVFDGARLDLADLRLYDTGGREVPYALRVRSPKDSTEAVEAREFNRVRDSAGASQLSLDLGETRIEHNEVEVKTPGKNFRRRVLLEGSDDGDAWNKLSNEDLIHFEAGSEKLIDEAVSYAPSRYRYLRITVNQDRQVDDDPVKIGKVTVRRRVKMPGEIEPRTVPFGEREPVRADGAPGSAWIIDLGGDAVPCDRIMVEIADAEFHRNYRIEYAGLPDSGEPFRRISGGRGVWRRRAGEEKTEMVAEFGEVRAARLKLVVTDHRNPPLQIQSVKAAAPVRAVIAAREPSLAGPLRLYFGNAKAEAPNYDFARNLPQKLDPSPVRLTPGDRQVNPVYQPEPLPLTERLPWLIYVLLGAAVAVLGALIISLARAAITVADARQATM